MTNPNRTPAGVPAGGQFAASTRAEASVDLEDLDVYGNTDECVAIEAHLTSVDDDGYCNHCGSDDPDPETDEPAPRPEDAIAHPEHRAACLAFAERYAHQVDLTDPDDFETEVARIVAETGENESDLRERLTRACQPRNISPLDANQTNRANGRARVGDDVIFDQPMHGSTAYRVIGKMHRREIVGADENGVQWAESAEVEYVLKNLENGSQTTAGLTGPGWRRIPAPGDNGPAAQKAAQR